MQYQDAKAVCRSPISLPPAMDPAEPSANDSGSTPVPAQPGRRARGRGGGHGRAQVIPPLSMSLRRGDERRAPASRDYEDLGVATASISGNDGPGPEPGPVLHTNPPASPQGSPNHEAGAC